MYAYVCLVLTETRKVLWIFWKWSYRQMWAAMRLLGTETGSSARAASVLNH